MATTTKPQEITVGDWTWAEEEEGGGDPALRHHDVEFWAGSNVTATGLRQAALDLMKLASQVASRTP
jgi:hypothetical protein